ncbi:MAG TPA: carboxymuconolactone decarboxylase family protein, partial [Bacteroidota bacterium]
REIVNVVVLSLQGLERQLLSHLRGALRTGISIEELREILTLAGKQSGGKGIAAKYTPFVVSLRKNS